MSAQVFDLRVFQGAVHEARRANLGPNATKALVKRVRSEQLQGRTGQGVVSEVAQKRIYGRGPQPPSAA